MRSSSEMAAAATAGGMTNFDGDSPTTAVGCGPDGLWPITSRSARTMSMVEG